jgi:hypothetical protein
LSVDVIAVLLTLTDIKLSMKTSSQFHQHFFVRIFRTNVVLAAFSSYVLALASKFRTKNARVNDDEIDTCCLKFNYLLQILKLHKVLFTLEMNIHTV